jgi:sulfur carrier protein
MEMNILVNGEQVRLERAMNVAELLETLGRTGQSIAIALNMDFVPRSAYKGTPVKEGDSIEIVEPRQGG